MLLEPKSLKYLLPVLLPKNFPRLAFREGFLGGAAAADKSLQSCPTLHNPIDSSPPGSPVPGILQARTLEWVAIPSPVHEGEK